MTRGDNFSECASSFVEPVSRNQREPRWDSHHHSGRVRAVVGHAGSQRVTRPSRNLLTRSSDLISNTTPPVRARARLPRQPLRAHQRAEPGTGRDAPEPRTKIETAPPPSSPTAACGISSKSLEKRPPSSSAQTATRRTVARTCPTSPASWSLRKRTRAGRGSCEATRFPSSRAARRATSTRVVGWACSAHVSSPPVTLLASDCGSSSGARTCPR